MGFKTKLILLSLDTTERCQKTFFCPSFFVLIVLLHSISLGKLSLSQEFFLLHKNVFLLTWYCNNNYNFRRFCITCQLGDVKVLVPSL